MSAKFLYDLWRHKLIHLYKIEYLLYPTYTVAHWMRAMNASEVDIFLKSWLIGRNKFIESNKQNSVAEPLINNIEIFSLTFLCGNLEQFIKCICKHSL